MLTINPAITRAHTLRGQCLYQKGHYIKAESDFAISLQADKIEMEAIFGYYRSMMKTKKLNLVLPVFSRINHKMKQFIVTWNKKSIQNSKLLNYNPNQKLIHYE